MASFSSKVGFQPEIVPSLLAKMNKLGAEFPFFITLKNGVLLETMPVGLPFLPSVAAGIVTTPGARVLPSRWYSVETLVPLLLTRIMLSDEDAMPQGLTSLLVVCFATPEMSDWTFVHE